jgi:hypothetical protein
MRLFIVVALAVFWVAMAYREYERGDMLLAFVFVLAGVALTGYRLSRLR